MDHPLSDIIEQQVRKAEAEGRMNDLAGAGKPLNLKDDPVDTLVSRTMREAGYVPEPVRLRHVIAELSAQLHAAHDAADRERLKGELAHHQTRLALFTENAERAR